MKDQEYKYSRLQQRQHIKTLHPISILKKSTRRRLGGCGINNPRIFWRQESRPSNFCKQKQEARGATLSECNFYEKLHPPKKNSEQPRRLKGPSGFLSQQARGSEGYTHWVHFCPKVHISRRKDKEDHLKISLQERTQNKSTTTWPLKLNHEMLGGLSMRDP